MIKNQIEPAKVIGLGEDEQMMLKKLLNVYDNAAGANIVKEKYYEGKIRLDSVNLGIALPQGMAGLEIGCSWGAKTVDVLAARSMFDGFVGENGEEVEELAKIVRSNSVIAEYPKACRDELKIGCSFATLSADDDIGCKIRFHSARSAAAVWDGEKGRIAYGFAVIDLITTKTHGVIWTKLNLYTDSAIWVMRLKICSSISMLCVRTVTFISTWSQTMLLVVPP